MNRLCIYTKDIQIITGKSDKYCRGIIANIKKLHNKQKHQPISIDEFCKYLGLDVDEVKKIIK